MSEDQIPRPSEPFPEVQEITVTWTKAECLDVARIMAHAALHGIGTEHSASAGEKLQEAILAELRQHDNWPELVEPIQ